jgi:hypothetical protein
MLFPTHVWGGGVDAQQERQYDVAPDGRFLINMELESAAAPITRVVSASAVRLPPARETALPKRSGAVR